MRYLSSIISVLLAFFFSGCVYDDILEAREEGELHPGDPYTLTFTLGVPSMEMDGTDGGAKTRAIYYGNPVYYEDWIDTQEGIRVLFFLSRREKTGPGSPTGQYDDTHSKVAVDPKNPKKDYFLFESTSRWATQLPYDEDGNLRYQVTVPVYQIGNEETEYREYWEDIRKLLRENDFKIAILANHPANGFTWTVENSVLKAPDINDLSTAKNLKTVNDIHHSTYDNNYFAGSAGRSQGYRMLYDQDGNMGPNIDWVTYRSILYGDALGGTFNTRESARTWLRNYWRPHLKYNDNTDEDYELLYHDFRNVWAYWNFGGLAPENALPYSLKSKINTHINEWEERNGHHIRTVISNAVQNDEGKLTDFNTGPQGGYKNDGSLPPLVLHPSSAKAVITTANDGKKFYGISLPALSSAPTATSASDCFSFTLRTKGTITVNYIDNGGGTINVRANTANLLETTTTTRTINGVRVTTYTGYYDQNANNPCFVYSTKGNPIVLDVEYCMDEYIYLTDREGVLPSHDHPIPMYGIQKFDRLGGFWDEGASFDLTTGGATDEGDIYSPKSIYLLRAVAKIEVLLPKSIGVPRHVYMRSLNRHVRCEPMDVATPTNEIWKDHDNGCEWQSVQEHAMMYDNGEYTAASYQKKLCWFYGNWLEWGWNFNNVSGVVPDYDKEGPFPRIFNPQINRSDFAAFIDVSDYYNDQYYHFLFYMGENTLDAPSTYSGSGSCQVPHIEIRFDERYAATSKVTTNSTYNLGDEDCYRIYFCPGGIASGARDANGVTKIPKDKYASQYEKKPEYLKEHWPIIRNHIYKFIVQDVTSDGMNGLVVEAQNRSVDFNFK